MIYQNTDRLSAARRAPRIDYLRLGVWLAVLALPFAIAVLTATL